MRATNPLGRSARGGTNLPNSASPQHNRKPFYTAQLEVVQPPNSANPPLLHSTSPPIPARAAEHGARITARAKRCSGAGIAISTSTPIGLPPSSFATGLTSGTANGSPVIHRTY